MLDLTDAELLQFFQKFKKIVPLKDKRIAFKTYKESFSGKKAVKIVVEHFNLEKEKAKELIQVFLDKEFMVHATHASKEFKNEYCYRFTNYRRVSKKYIKVEIPTEPEIPQLAIVTTDEQASTVAPVEAKKKMSLTQKLGSLLFGTNKAPSTENKTPDTPRGAKPPTSPQLPTVPASPRMPLQLPTNLVPPKSPTFSTPLSPRGLTIPKMPRSPSKEELVSNHSVPDNLPLSARRKSRSFADCSSYVDSGLPNSFHSEKTFTFGSVINKVKRKPITAVDISNKKIKRHSSEADLLKDIQKSLSDIEAQTSLKYMSKQKLIGLFQKASLDEILNDFEMRQLVKAFAKEEYAEETVLFWEMVQAYKKIPDDASHTEERMKRAHEIYKLFVLETGDLALNINQQLITQCTNMFLTKETPKMFDATLVAVKGQIADLVERFKMSMVMH